MAVAVIDGKMTMAMLRALIVIGNFTGQHGFPPTLEEIAEALGLRSTGAVRKSIARLKLEGFLCNTSGGSRNSLLSEKANRLLSKLGAQ